MRSLIFWLVTVGCLLVAAKAFQLPNIEEPEEDVLDEVAEDEDVDVGRMLGDLFEDEEIDEDDDDDEEVTGRQLATVTVSEQERFNTFMDTILAQLELQAKRDLEPLKFTLTKPKKKSKNGKKKQKKNKSKKDKNKDKNNDKKEDKDEKIKKKDSENVELSDMEEELHQIQRREAETEEEVTGRKASEDDEDIGNEKRNKNRRKNNKNKNNNKKNNNKKNNKKNNKRKSNNKVVLQGLSHIKREGDVKLYNMNKGRILRTEIAVGPVELDITRKINDEEHKAAATADKLNGVLLIKVNKNGKPRVKKLVLKRPSEITTTGSIARGIRTGKGLFKKSIKQVSPTAAKKLFRAAKQIIQNV